MFIKIAGKTHYLWRAVDQHGNVLDILVTARRDATAASRFFRKLLKGLEGLVSGRVRGSRWRTAGMSPAAWSGTC